MNQNELLKKLSEISRWRTDLQPMIRLAEKLGKPQDNLKFIHVAGTNGKGSTSSMISNVLISEGYRTGQFISPYILDFRERMQINGEMISDNDLVRLGAKVLSAIEELKDEGVFVSEFDAVTAIALMWFKEKKCDYVVLEVGVGGRIDSTNIISPESTLVSVITSVSLDHTGILGDTEEEIALEKTGIFKENGRAVVSGFISDSTLNVIKKEAESKSCRLTITDRNSVKLISSDSGSLKLKYKDITFTLPMSGLYQVQNCITAMAVIEQLKEQNIAISDKSIFDGMGNTCFPARMQKLSDEPLIYLDGAHNIEGAKALKDTLNSIKVKGEKICICGMMSDKSCTDVVELLAPGFDYAITVTPSNPRSLSKEDLAELWRSFGVDAVSSCSLEEAISKAYELSMSDGLIICCGSLYLCSEILPVAQDFVNNLNK